MRYVLFGLHALGVIAIAHALMLLGADEITSIERGGIRTIRSFTQILTLYGADPTPWMEAFLPAIMVNAVLWLFSAPAWLILFAGGGALTLLTRRHV